MVEISINHELKFSVELDNSTILEHAFKNDIIINHSCLNGRCSECKVKVISGGFEMSSTQEGLADQEINEGYCLSCVTRPISNLELDEVVFHEGILPKIKTIPVKISKIDFLSKNVAKVTLRTPPNNSLKFIAGQYINLSIRNIKRSFSISSIPSDSNIELIIKNYPNGQFSNYLFNEAKVDDLLRLEGPIGTYILPAKIPKKLLFVSTGTGIAPNLSLIKSIIQEDIIQGRQIILIHGQRTADEHVYSLNSLLNEIKVILTTSRESVEGYKKGYVQDAVKELKLDMDETMIFACGNPKMIKDLKFQMISMGLADKNFKSDAFVPSN